MHKALRDAARNFFLVRAAVASRSVFMTGAELQAGLAAGVAWRAQFGQLSDEERQRNYDEYSFYPVELPDSPINAVWDIAWVQRLPGQLAGRFPN